MPKADRDRARLPEGRHEADFLKIPSIVGDTVGKCSEHGASFFWNEFFVTFLRKKSKNARKNSLIFSKKQ